MAGASARSSRVRAPAYRSPDASPQDSSRRSAQDAGRCEQRGVERAADLHVGDRAFEDWLAADARRSRRNAICTPSTGGSR